MPGRPVKEPKESSGRRGRRNNGDGQGGKVRRKRNDAAKVDNFPHLLHYTRNICVVGQKNSVHEKIWSYTFNLLM